MHIGNSEADSNTIIGCAFSLNLLRKNWCSWYILFRKSEELVHLVWKITPNFETLPMVDLEFPPSPFIQDRFWVIINFLEDPLPLWIRPVCTLAELDQVLGKGTRLGIAK